MPLFRDTWLQEGSCRLGGLGEASWSKAINMKSFNERRRFKALR